MIQSFANLELWFTDQNSKPLDTADKINITEATKSNVIYKKTCVTQLNLKNEYLLKVMDFCYLLKIWAKILAKI